MVFRRVLDSSEDMMMVASENTAHEIGLHVYVSCRATYVPQTKQQPNDWLFWANRAFRARRDKITADCAAILECD